MKPNKLYSYIQHHFAALSSIFPIKNKENKQQQAYFLLDLPQQPITIQLDKEACHLRSHHISIYQYQDGENACLSQYHYTAELIDDANTKYELHVYLDENDQFTIDAILSVITANGEKTRLEIDASQNDQFQQLAVNLTLKIINQLRQKQTEHFAELKRKYKAIEAELSRLSEQAEENAEAYLAKLTEAKVILELLAALDNQEYYNNVIKLLTAIERKLFVPAEIPTNNDDESSEEDFADDIESRRPRGKDKIVNPQTIVQRNKKYYRAQVVAAEQALASYQQLTASESFEVKLKSFQRFDDTIRQLLAASLETTTTVADLQKENTLQSQRHSLGEKLLSFLLLKEQFEMAKQLSEYTKAIADGLIVYALRSGKAELLHFLLEHTPDFPINTFIVDKGLTAAAYCVKEHSDKTPKATCLSVLLEHDASLMVRDTEGYPAAFHLVATTHRLRPVLEQPAHFKKTLGSALFYSKLINFINAFLANNILNPDIQKNLAATRESFWAMRENISSGVASSTLAKVTRQGDDNLSPTVSAQLTQDPRHKQALRDFLAARNDFLQTQSKRVIQQVVSEMIAVQESLNSFLKFINFADASDLVEENVDVLHKATEYFKQKLAQFEVQEEIRKLPPGNGRGKKVNRLLNQQRLLHELTRAYEVAMKGNQSAFKHEAEVQRKSNEALVQIVLPRICDARERALYHSEALVIAMIINKLASDASCLKVGEAITIRVADAMYCVIAQLAAENQEYVVAKFPSFGVGGQRQLPSTNLTTTNKFLGIEIPPTLSITVKSVLEARVDSMLLYLQGKESSSPYYAEVKALAAIGLKYSTGEASMNEGEMLCAEIPKEASFELIQEGEHFQWITIKQESFGNLQHRATSSSHTKPRKFLGIEVPHSLNIKVKKLTDSYSKVTILNPILAALGDINDNPYFAAAQAIAAVLSKYDMGKVHLPQGKILIAEIPNVFRVVYLKHPTTDKKGFSVHKLPLFGTKQASVNAGVNKRYCDVDLPQNLNINVIDETEYLHDLPFILSAIGGGLGRDNIYFAEAVRFAQITKEVAHDKDKLKPGQVLMAEVPSELALHISRDTAAAKPKMLILKLASFGKRSGVKGSSPLCYQGEDLFPNIVIEIEDSQFLIDLHQLLSSVGVGGKENPYYFELRAVTKILEQINRGLAHLAANKILELTVPDELSIECQKDPASGSKVRYNIHKLGLFGRIQDRKLPFANPAPHEYFGVTDIPASLKITMKDM